MPLSVGDKLGHYEVVSLLGQGGMGEVYRAKDTKLDRDVAIKVLPQVLARDPERLARFEREAKVLASLDHPNIGHIHGIVDSEDSRGLVLALIEGPTLADRIAAGSLPEDEAIAIAKQIIEALEYAHDRGVVHRDLKPANVKITPEGVVKVLDFGLAKVLEDEPPQSSLTNSPTLTVGHTRAGVILGTAAYMSPEQAVGRTVDRRSDIFSFGAVLFEMLTGKRAFPGSATPDVLESVVKNDPDWSALPAGTPGYLRRLLERMLAKDRKQRLQAIGEARIALENPSVAKALPHKAAQTAWAVAAVLGMTALVIEWVHFRETPPALQTLRYTIAAPENSVVSHFAISPDGRNLAMAASVNGKQQLWLRPMDGLEAKPMPFTEDAIFPFWSPDSRYIAFFSQQKLKRVDLTGGPAQTLCDAGAGPRGGAWGRDDMILFSAGTTGLESAIQRVSTGGGVPLVIAKSKDNYFHPTLLPDGRHYLYVLTRGPAAGVYFATPADPGGRQVLKDESRVVFADGYLLFVRDNTLMAQPFDPEKGNTTGDAVPVVDGVSPGSLNYAPISASDTGLLVYQKGDVSSALRTQPLEWRDRTGRVIGELGAAGGTPNLSPDEKTIAFVRSKGPRAFDLWLWDVARGTPARFTGLNGGSFGSIWSLKGDQVVFTHSDPRGGYEILRKAASGSGQEETVVPRVELPLRVVTDWSRDGKFLTFTQIGSKRKMELWAVPMTGGDRTPFPFLQSESHEEEGKFSPDGHWMAYISDESGAFEVYVRPFPSGEGRYKVSTAGGFQPRWRRDGKELFYVAADGKMTAVSIKSSAGSEPTIGRPEPLFDSHIEIEQLTNVYAPAPLFDYDVSADGNRFLVAASKTQTPVLNVEVNWAARLKR